MDSLLVTDNIGVPTFIDDFLYNTIGTHYILAAILIVAMIVVIYMLYKKKEGFMPTQLMKQQQISLSGSEAMENKGRAQSAFAQLQDDSAAVLAGDFSCDGADMKKDTDAWQWQIGVANEPMSNKKTDNQLSKVMAGL